MPITQMFIAPKGKTYHMNLQYKEIWEEVKSVKNNPLQIKDNNQPMKRFSIHSQINIPQDI